MFGGAGLRKNYAKSREDAFYEFMSNAKFKILTDGSISAITLLATYNGDPANSPYISLSPDNFMKPATRILVKIMPSHADATVYTDIINKSGDQGTRIEINNYATIQEEYEIQKRVYRKSVFDETGVAFNPICPSILFHENPVSDKDKFCRMLAGNIEARARKSLDNEKDELEDLLGISNTNMLGGSYNWRKHVDAAAAAAPPRPVAGPAPPRPVAGPAAAAAPPRPVAGPAAAAAPPVFVPPHPVAGPAPRRRRPHNPPNPPITNFSIIVMEFLEGYDVLDNTYKGLTDLQKQHVTALVDIELLRLHNLGYFHGDFHKKNGMYIKTAKYASNIDPSFYGKAMIIDFGRTIDGLKNTDDLRDKHLAAYGLPYLSYMNCYNEAINYGSMTSSECLNEEALHRPADQHGNQIPLSTQETLFNYANAIVDVGKKKLNTLLSNFGVPGMTPEQLKQRMITYINSKAIILPTGGGDIPADVTIDEVMDVFYNSLMQDDTPETFNVADLFSKPEEGFAGIIEGLKKYVNVEEIAEVPHMASMPEMVPVYGGRSSNKTRKGRKSRRYKKNKTNNKSKSRKYKK